MFSFLKHNVILLPFLGMFIAAQAGMQGQADPVMSARAALRDTVLKRDSNMLDPKKGFRDLFVHSEIGDGISVQQLNPRAVSFVKDYIARHNKGLQKMKEWGRPYFDMMDAVLLQYGLPRELKYLAVIESHLKSGAVSWAGAVGPWQFMPATARRYGLKVTAQYDERTDYLKSTHAAARMLKDLFGIYGDWLLVIAAYNGGPGNVDRAIRLSGSRDFWTLQHRLPNESKDHVKKFISTHYIMEGNGGVTTLTKGETKIILPGDRNGLSSGELDSSLTENIGGKYDAGVMAKYLEMDLATFNRYNPSFRQRSAVDGHYELRLPAEKMKLFREKKHQILEESMRVLLEQVGF